MILLLNLSECTACLTWWQQCQIILWLTGFFVPYDLQNKLIKTDQLLIELYIEHTARLNRPYKTCKEGHFTKTLACTLHSAVQEGADYMKHAIIIIIIIIIIIVVVIIIIIIIIWYGCLLSQAFSSWYFSWTSGDPHCSGFKLHTAVLSVLCVMFQV